MRSRTIEEYKRGLALCAEQREALVGLLLGDAHLEGDRPGRTYRLKIEQSDRRRAYVEHLHRLFHEWVLTPPQPKIVRSRGHASVNWWFQTVRHKAFQFYATQFYRDGRKCVPRLLDQMLTPRGLAYWFMDDGSRKWRQSRAVLLNTQGYPKEDVEYLAQVLLQNFGLETYLRRQRDGYQIVIAGRSLERFAMLIAPYLLPEMWYKLPRVGQTQLPKR